MTKIVIFFEKTIKKTLFFYFCHFFSYLGSYLGSDPKLKNSYWGQTPARGRIQIRTPAAALPIAPNKAVSTATATFAIVFQCRIFLSSFLYVPSASGRFSTTSERDSPALQQCLICTCKDTTFCSRFQEKQPYRVSQNHADEK